MVWEFDKFGQSCRNERCNKTIFSTENFQIINKSFIIFGTLPSQAEVEGRQVGIPVLAADIGFFAQYY